MAPQEKRRIGFSVFNTLLISSFLFMVKSDYSDIKTKLDKIPDIEQRVAKVETDVLNEKAQISCNKEDWIAQLDGIKADVKDLSDRTDEFIFKEAMK
jgi:hypothetical protein